MRELRIIGFEKVEYADDHRLAEHRGGTPFEVED